MFNSWYPHNNNNNYSSKRTDIYNIRSTRVYEVYYNVNNVILSQNTHTHSTYNIFTVKIEF